MCCWWIFLHSTMLRKAIKLMKDDYIEELVTSDPVLCQDKLFQQTSRCFNVNYLNLQP